MQVNAKLYGVRLSAQKGRLVADLVRGQPIANALNILTFTPKKGAKIIKKVLESAIASPLCTLNNVASVSTGPSSSESPPGSLRSANP